MESWKGKGNRLCLLSVGQVGSMVTELEISLQGKKGYYWWSCQELDSNLFAFRPGSETYVCVAEFAFRNRCFSQLHACVVVQSLNNQRTPLFCSPLKTHLPGLGFWMYQICWGNSFCVCFFSLFSHQHHRGWIWVNFHLYIFRFLHFLPLSAIFGMRMQRYNFISTHV